MTALLASDARPARARAATLVALLAIVVSVASLAAVHPADAALGEKRPYDAGAAWNTKIGSDPVILPGSLGFVRAVTDNDLPLTSDPDQYAIPVYYFDGSTPRETVNVEGSFSSYDAGDDSRVAHGSGPVDGVPVPAIALSSAGSDGQIVIWDPETGVEYAFWQFDRDASGRYTATNGWRYHTTSGYYGRFADGKAGRGAGTPYFAGLVRPWEIARGRIDHALAFAYDSPAPSMVYPASKTDGGGVLGTDPPEGSLLQLDPSLDSKDFDRWGLSSMAKIIAKALQTYGMYVIDNSGSSKIYLEDRLTAGWPASVDRNLPAKIPLSEFRVVRTRASAGGDGPGQECGAWTTDAAPPQKTQLRTALGRLTHAMRRVSARSMRTRSGPQLRVRMRSGSGVHVRVSRRVGGRKRLLSSARTVAECGRAKFRLRPTSAGRRALRRGRLVNVELRFRAFGSSKTTSRSRAVRLRR